MLYVLDSFSWTQNGTHFDVDKDPLVAMKPGSGTLIINIMSEGKAETYEGVYQCTARNERGAAISNNIVIRPSSKCKLVDKCPFLKDGFETQHPLHCPGIITGKQWH